MSRRKHGLAKRIVIDIGGFGLIILGILTGWLPGPGGIPLILAGLGILSLNYEWAHNLLQNFEKKRQELTETYLNPGPPGSWILDIVSALVAASGIIVIYTQSHTLFKGLGIGLVFAGFITLLSNQRRIDRILKRTKNKH